MPGYFECADSQVLAALDHSLAAFRRRLRPALTRRCAPPSPACGRGASTGPARCCWRLPLTHAGEGLNAEGTRVRGKSAGRRADQQLQLVRHAVPLLRIGQGRLLAVDHRPLGREFGVDREEMLLAARDIVLWIDRAY